MTAQNGLDFVKKPRYSVEWAGDIVEMFISSNARATEILLKVYGIDESILAGLLAHASPLWGFFKSRVHTLGKAMTHTTPDNYTFVKLFAKEMTNARENRYLGLLRHLTRIQKLLELNSQSIKRGEGPRIAGTEPLSYYLGLLTHEDMNYEFTFPEAKQ